MKWSAVEISIFSILSLLVPVGGWFVVDLLSRRRDRQRDNEARKLAFCSAASDFDAEVDKWLHTIHHSVTLAADRTKSKPDVERVMVGIRKHVANTAKDRLAKEWKNYEDIQAYELEPIRIPPGFGTGTRHDYMEARNILSEPLKKMKEIIREV